MGLSDLPDIINIDDNWWEDMSEKEAHIMIDSCIEEFQDELGFSTAQAADAPIYSIDE
jgi:hypothetical protein